MPQEAPDRGMAPQQDGAIAMGSVPENSWPSARTRPNAAQRECINSDSGERIGRIGTHADNFGIGLQTGQVLHHR